MKNLLRWTFFRGIATVENFGLIILIIPTYFHIIPIIPMKYAVFLALTI